MQSMGSQLTGRNKPRFRAPRDMRRHKIVWPNCQLQTLRKLAGLRLRDVATSADMSLSWLSLLERGADPKLHDARTLAVFFGKTVDEIWIL